LQKKEKKLYLNNKKV